MWLGLVCYLVAFLIFIILYEYYKHSIRKQIAKLDFLEHLDNTQGDTILGTNRKSLDSIEKEIHAYSIFDRFRVIFAIDFSASNERQGRNTFNGQSLHKINGTKIYNPYQKVISQLGVAFEKLFSSKIDYSCFQFGDTLTRDLIFVPISSTGEKCSNYQNILNNYIDTTKNVEFSGPTSYIPIVNKLISDGIHYEKDFTMLVLLTDELKVSCKDHLFVETLRTLSKFENLCLIIVGVGDGPWQNISYEERNLRELMFKDNNKKNKRNLIQSNIIYDNFHIVDFNIYNSKINNYFAHDVLRKLPGQLKQVAKNKKTT